MILTDIDIFVFVFDNVIPPHLRNDQISFQKVETEPQWINDQSSSYDRSEQQGVVIPDTNHIPVQVQYNIWSIEYLNPGE
uniref:Uncharacterized protein n=1 Tax=Nelumbo nucifera TaxID=4432 RepID=A0A822YPA9_NELNU|nr:TPA_asm: hypothetical protein HUJ06_012020 [Nelumbo nucifera]